MNKSPNNEKKSKDENYFKKGKIMIMVLFNITRLDVLNYFNVNNLGQYGACSDKLLVQILVPRVI